MLVEVPAICSISHNPIFFPSSWQILREQLSPFDIELRSVERQLNFSEAGKAVARFLANRNRRLFSMSTENALITLLREGVTVQESSVDSKRDLEDALRTACNEFIDHTCKSVAGDLLQYLETCKENKNKFTQSATSKVLSTTSESVEESMGEVKGFLYGIG